MVARAGPQLDMENYGETTYTQGSSSTNWGHSWTADEINTGFRVRQIFTISGSNGRGYLDWVPVEVTYTASPPTVIPAPSAVVSV